ncbi:glycosyltransferase family 2 protein [Rivularia sp. UHCC 0363]|uniref:glycosyltransferase family 2 protein n=1 Tax=Rivularia sp. UHCC 0363 TaxID=3110244 RepID=UPI002B1F4906|nr:glycosyltransferase [Rivularia sp. UHCC 0363]MEA5594579.1 glycosyltransferase [Rivularia sp. UHCC 0363]
MHQPKVTIVVSPRERFSFSRESLESIYENTTVPFQLIYVDGNSPNQIKKYLQEKSQEKGFQLIRTDYYLAPNQARNLAIPHVDTEYLLFVDNDVLVSRGWLKTLLECAEETEATVVCPLTCIGKNIGEKIHLAGGEARIEEKITNKGKTKRKVHEVHYFVNRKVADVKEELHRKKCEFAEFHCMLVRTQIFDQIGLLDEGFLSTREHIDFCMTVNHAGGSIYCEPTSVVTYVPDLKWEIPELSFFMLRWSDAWEIASLEHFADKWNLPTKDKYFEKRYNRMGYRRHNGFLKPFLSFLTFGWNPLWLQKWAISIEHKINKWITDNYEKNLPQKQKLSSPQAIEKNRELVTN